MMKRKKAILCALAGIGFITSVSTVKANAMTMNTSNTTKCIQHKLSASEVEDLMWDLPYTIKTNFNDQLKTTLHVMYAEAAYQALPENKKCYVDPSALDNLEHAEKTLQRVIGDEAKAFGLVCGVVKLEKQVGYNKDTREINNKSEVISNRADIQKQMQSLEETYQSLDYSIRDKNGLPHFMEELTRIEAKVAGIK